MLTQKVTFVDFGGVKRTETVYFNLSELEILELEVESAAGLQAELQAAVEGVDNRRMLAFVKKLLERSYGEMSGDGRLLDKSPEITNKMVRSAWYSDFLFSLFINGGDRATKFINGILPADKIRNAAAKAKGETIDPNTLSPKERWDMRQQQNNFPEVEVEVVDFSDFSLPEAVEAYQDKNEVVEATIEPEQPGWFSDQTAHVTPLPDGEPTEQTEATRKQLREQEEFLQWKAEREAAAAEAISRPPHEGEARL